ncbi:unnamed protein product [Blepharisma stoltei]|uniref:Uncharacterized protein n=1 Tax=Blepharisma stoltei TaxID=1481888 RepID=A0AAU9JT08_9CILI|nr:unnamed protein product [Blepharisma stoltei]
MIFFLTLIRSIVISYSLDILIIYNTDKSLKINELQNILSSKLISESSISVIWIEEKFSDQLIQSNNEKWLVIDLTSNLEYPFFIISAGWRFRICSLYYWWL